MKALLYVMCGIAVTMLAGCGGEEHQDIRKWMDDSSRDLRGKAPPLPELKPFPVVSYSAGNFPDPFSADRVEPEKKEGGGKKPDFDRPREPLEAYPLESMKYIGLVNKMRGKARHALILADGVVHQAGVGSYLGQNFGRITAVSDNEIVLVETVQDPSGNTTDWVERPKTLQLQEGAQAKEGKK